MFCGVELEKIDCLALFDVVFGVVLLRADEDSRWAGASGIGSVLEEKGRLFDSF